MKLPILFLFILVSTANAQLRGVNASPYIFEREADNLAAHGVTITRNPIWVDSSQLENWDFPNYFANVEFALNYIDYICDLYQKRGIKMILTMPSPPGGKLLFRKDRSDLRQNFIDTWAYIANRYKDNPCINSFDLLNEPNTSSGNIQRLFNATAAQIKSITTKPIWFSSRLGLCSKLSELKTTSDPQIGYTCHIYAPMRFTHQGVKGRKTGITSYKAALRKEIGYLRSFERKVGNMRLYVGEGGADRYAPPLARLAYMKDLLDGISRYNYTVLFSGEADGFGVWEPSSEIWQTLEIQ